jgi:hypothetical protein
MELACISYYSFGVTIGRGLFDNCGKYDDLYSCMIGTVAQSGTSALRTMFDYSARHFRRLGGYIFKNGTVKRLLTVVK